MRRLVSCRGSVSLRLHAASFSSWSSPSSSLWRVCALAAQRRQQRVARGHGGGMTSYVVTMRRHASTTATSSSSSRQDDVDSSSSNDNDDDDRSSAIEAAVTKVKTDYLVPHDGVFRFVASTTPSRPMIMLLGNHSCGKSTLLNYLAGRDIQATGVAPTDDGFTVVQRADYDMNEDGPTAVSTPDGGFTDLQKFGDAFVSRFRVKTRRMPAHARVPRGLQLVDTPGMIDTPVHVANRTSFAGQMRGYDFLAVTAWFARRCDVVLLMFDPANPGTTGETLDVLTHALSGVEHKLLLVLNKVDMFEKATDFARTYGTLCWNLSKIVPIKDIPPIYTTCTPQLPAAAADSNNNSNNNNNDTTKTKKNDNDASGDAATRRPRTASALMSHAEFGQQFADVVAEIVSAPLRHLDNLITETEESARCLLQASRVCAQLHHLRHRTTWRYYGAVVATCVLAPVAAAYALAPLSLSSMLLSGVATTLLAGAALALTRNALQGESARLLSRIDVVYEQLYGGHDKTTASELRWRNVVRPRLLRIAGDAAARGQDGIAVLPRVRARHCRGMEYALHTALPQLRATASARRHAVCAHHRGGDRARRRDGSEATSA